MRRLLVEPAERAIDAVGVEQFERALALGGDDVQRRVRRGLLQPRQQRRHHRDAQAVGRRQPEGAAGLGRVELRHAGDAGFDQRDRLAQRLAHRFGARRQDEAVRSAHQELVAGQVAQPLQCVADRRLRAAEPFPRAGDVALGDQCVEHLEEIEVEAAQVHAGKAGPALVW